MLYIPFTNVSVRSTDDYLGIVEKDPVEIDRGTDPLEVDYRIICALAGMAAEGRFSGRTRWMYGSGDFNFAFDLAAKLDHLKSADDVQHYLTYLWSRAKSLLDRPGHWTAVEQVAAALLADGELMFDEVYDICRPILHSTESVRQTATASQWRITRSPSTDSLAGSVIAYEIRRSLRGSRRK